MRNPTRYLLSSVAAIAVLATAGLNRFAVAQEIQVPGYHSVDTDAVQAKIEQRRSNVLSKTLVATDTVGNPGFEKDAVLLDPWVVVDSGGGSWYVQTGTLAPLGLDTVPAPPEGVQAAMTDQPGPGTHILYQDVTLIQSPAVIELKYDLFVDNTALVWDIPGDGSLSYNVSPNQHIRVDIMDPGAAIDDVDAGVWANLFTPVPGVDTTTFGYTEMSADLSAFAGQTVRLRFAEADNQGNLYMGVDDVRLTQTPVLPATPTLLTPLNGAVDIPLEGVELRWSLVTYATRYNVQVATDPAFSSIVWSTNVPDRQVFFIPPEPGTTYYWRAQSEGLHGKSKFSAPFHFTTVMPIPDVPTLLTPLNGATNVPNTVELRWTEEEWAVRYNVQVATDAAFTALVFSTNVPDRQVQFIAPAQGVTYFWRAQSVGDFGNSNFSAPFHFTTENLTPGVVTLVAPPFGAVDLEIPVTLEWNAAVNADEYLLQVATDSMFADTVLSTVTTEVMYEFVAPFAGETYYWRVQGMGPGGTSPGFSDVWKFSVGMEGSLLPTTVYPVSGATDVPVDVTLQWQAPADGAAGTVSKASALAYYRVQVARDQSYDDPVVDEDSVMVDSLRVTGLRHNTLYYWRVAGVDESGRFTFTPSSSFTTIVAVPRRVSLVTPSSGATGVSALPLFVWQTAGGASTYDLQVADNQAFTSPAIDESGFTGTSFQTVAPLNYSTGYFWRVRAVNAAGSGEWSLVRSFTTVVGTAVETDEIPAAYALHDNYPNPFNPQTTITVDLPEATTFTLTVFDVTGHVVTVLASGAAPAGRHAYVVDGAGFASGLYLYRIESKALTQTKTMLLLK